MKHFGDITKIDGHNVPIVDVIVGGSPCQDLSIAGKRQGFNGERSSLFLDQIRIIKEMHDECRKSNQLIRPRFQIWENVPGCTSSNDGEDFRTVLEQTARIIDPDADIPRLAEGQLWPSVGCILADRWSIAWRVHDGQFWGKTIIDRRTGNIIKMGTPQRRRRMSLVADFRGQSAPEILFDREMLSGNLQSSEAPREESAADVGTSFDKPITFFERAGKEGGGKGILIQVDKAMSLKATNNQGLCQPTTIALEGNGARNSHNGDGYDESNVMYTLNTVERHAVCYRKTGHPINSEQVQGWEEAKVSDTLNIFDSTEARTPTVICQPNYVKVESEVAVRKYPVDTEKLIECLQNHRSITVKEIAEKLNKPKSLVDHWFRKDKFFAIPDADIWLQLKELLGIETDEFDESIMTFEYKACNFDAANRIHMGDTAPTLTSNCEDSMFCFGVDAYNQSVTGDVTMTLAKGKADKHSIPTVYTKKVCYGFDRSAFNQGQNAKFDFSIYEDSVAPLVSRGPNGVMANAVLRRLTPLECERLQGFPDGWTDIGEWVDSKGKKRQSTDSLRYTALGNSICLPFWEWLFSRIAKVIKKTTNNKPTMASLFDGIGGFPLAAARNGFEPVWASEIEEFQIAVTKKHFPEREEKSAQTPIKSRPEKERKE